MSSCHPGWRLDFLVSSRLRGGGGDRLPHRPRGSAPGSSAVESLNQVFYSARNARIASAVLATAIPSVCPSVCPSVRRAVASHPVVGVLTTLQGVLND